MNSARLEQTSIYLSIGGALFLAILGICFGLAVQSGAVLLDAFFNVITFVMALTTLWISRLLKRPEGRKFQFGYKGFSPLLNLCKSLLIAGLSMFAFASSAAALLHGGRHIDAGVVVIYAVIAAFTCLIISITHTVIAKKTGSPIVRVDAKNWMINGIIGLSVGIVFSIVTLIKQTSFAWFVPYADPTIVIILVLLTVPIPAKVILESLNQLLLGAPQAALQKRINDLLDVATTKFPCAKRYLRMTEVGEALYLHLYWLVPNDEKLTSIEAIDAMRHQITDIVKQEFPNVTLDILFTQDEQWFRTMNPG
ncbi:cation transporter [Nostoc sp. T09]|uniref:cation diffusion facilitator family transporter n=1 Tax=Nostoc sp. T09 TaxID=1932621 RepID=UPI000A36A2D4|nr:cation transporter [Nostoc sp. T09]OUL36979.1 cation transporter [Nostoc sp. T09]